MYDIIVIGAGPAGLSAAITSRARDKKVLVVSNKPQESALAKAKHVDNYPGLPQSSGLQILERMIAHARDLRVDFVYERVISVLPVGECFTVATGGANFDARAIILATGTHLGKPFKGEEEFLGRGVSYCATCDGMLYRGQTVCVVGLNAEARDEANFLAGIGAKVTFLTKKTASKEATLGLDENITVAEGAVVEIKGDMMGVSELVYRDARDRSVKSIPCTGVFVLRSCITPDALMAGLKLADGSVAVDHTMSTSMTGVFAAGDCVGRPLQVAIAVGEGQRACFSAVQYLDRI
jgi:thioredoxin reductase (NADPH)